MTQLFTCSPDPPCAGKPVKICYSGDLPGSADVTFTPPGPPPIPITFTAANPCATITVPALAITMVVEDDSGESDDFARPVKLCDDDELAAPKKNPKPKGKKK